MDSNSKSDDSIQVCVRVRPGQQDHSILDFTQNEIHLDKNHFGFDHIFPPSSTQDDVFQLVGTKVISHTLDGYNGCIFVYGQTGSGKTYTMMGDNNGLMQNSFCRLFMEIQAMKETECSITCSYYEIYNEQINDLLDIKKDKEKKMIIRQDMKKGVFVENMTEETVYSSDKLLECLNIGMRNRHVGQTMMNRESSRSHSIFTINFSIRSQVNGMKVLKTPKLHFVDLAGSERQKMTAASGDRLKEAGNINKSLTTLGMVINALACEKTRSHIPYRDSKLTSLLRDSLGGNSKTFLIATVSRNVLCFQETLSTLNFANRAKMVKVKALINEQSLSTNIETFKQEIRRLKAEILRLKSQKKSPSPSDIRFIPQPQHLQKIENYDNQFKQINEKISVISDHLIKNPVSPSIDAIMEQIQNMKTSSLSKLSRNNSTRQSQMKDESEENVEEGIEEEGKEEEAIEEDALIQYLSCNNTLLQKIHTKIDQYVELKQELRNMAYQNTMTIADLKTPSKFERDQYQQKLKEKETELESLNSEIRALHTLISEREIQIEELKSESLHRNGKIEERDEQIEKFIKDQGETRREISQLKNLLKQSNEEVQKVHKKYLEAQNQSKENKELYLYVEQNYETERAMRRKIEDNLFEKIDELSRVERTFNEKLEEQKEYFEENEERLKDQISVLTQTVDFNEKLLSEFREKLIKEQNLNEEIQKEMEQLRQNIKDLLRQKTELEQKLQQQQARTLELENVMEKNRQQNQTCKRNLEAEIRLIKNQLQRLKEENYVAIRAKDQTISQLNRQNQNLVMTINEKDNKMEEMESNFKGELQTKNLEIQNITNEASIMKNNFEQNITEKEQIIQSKQEQNQGLLNNKIQQQQKIDSLQMEIQNNEKQYQQTIRKMEEEFSLKLATAKKIEIENQELKKAHKDLLRDNYKLKAKYGNNSNKTEEELLSKVNYYEEKFKLMSIQYQKALEAVKKMKEREINQAKKISSLEENQKSLKINYQDHDKTDSLTEELKKENFELKKELEGLRLMKKSSLSKNCSYEKQKLDYTEKEQQMHSKVLGLILKLDPTKENVSNSKNLEELLSKWEELEAESEKKIDAIERGIKKQQKIKTQNKLIMKENIYLKEQVVQLEKDLMEMGGRPRKLVKKSLSQQINVDMQ